MPNRLASEKSPYLLQHAHNPVDWYPWCDEAFARAIEEDKPVFLSIGYSTCHWCHVMEHESFEDEQVAELLNETFICIKVDREERPDIDTIYMSACTMMTGGGGWPLTVIMTPDKKPFFVGTYFPKDSGYGRPGMMELVPRIREIWDKRRDEVIRSAGNILEILQEDNRTHSDEKPDHSIIHTAFEELKNRHDPEFGGFSKAPKFPTPHNITFLLRYWKKTGKGQALEMVERTLTAMHTGGIFDQLGYGFHRYSTDAAWLLPHFEKMLYDQALLAIAYLESYQVTENKLFKQAAEEIFTYVLRDMTAPEGGFYSAEDADSEGVEGKFYVWSTSELQAILSPDEFELIHGLFNIAQDGNFRDEATGALTGENILHLSKPMSSDEKSAFAGIRKKLFGHRAERVHPYRDDKILTDWNGLMIAALAMGYRILGNSRYLEAAAKASVFILSAMHDEKGCLLHRYRDDESAVNGLLGDYSYLVWGLLELYSAGFEAQYLSNAIALNSRMTGLFLDKKNGGFFLTPEGGEDLLVRPKEIYDGALPSANSVAIANLLRLGHLTGDTPLVDLALETLHAFYDEVSKAPSAYTQFLSSLSLALEPGMEIIVVGDPASEDTHEMLSIIRKSFLPSSVVLFKNSTADNRLLSEVAPFTEPYTASNGKCTVYVCRDRSCKSPTSDPEMLLKLLND